MKDPGTGKRVSRLKPASDRIATEVPDLRIVETNSVRLKAWQAEIAAEAMRVYGEETNRLNRKWPLNGGALRIERNRPIGTAAET